MKSLKEHLIEESGVAAVEYGATVTIKNEWCQPGTGEYAILSDNQLDMIEARIRVETRHEERKNATPNTPTQDTIRLATENERLRGGIGILQEEKENYSIALGDLREVKGELKEVRANSERLQERNEAIVISADNLRNALKGSSVKAIKTAIAEYDTARANLPTRGKQ